MCSACGLGQVTMRELFPSLMLPNLKGKDCYSFKHCPLVEKINISAFRTSTVQVSTSTWKMPSPNPPSAFLGRNRPFNNVS